ncbi:MAG: flagellar hook-length control protein FliK [candidate division KSB1 bacterium]|nr:flagellar hook-length control protein FliK [candidate division KSB1 bacterium]
MVTREMELSVLPIVAGTSALTSHPEPQPGGEATGTATFPLLLAGALGSAPEPVPANSLQKCQTSRCTGVHGPGQAAVQCVGEREGEILRVFGLMISEPPPLNEGASEIWPTGHFQTVGARALEGGSADESAQEAAAAAGSGLGAALFNALSQTPAGEAEILYPQGEGFPESPSSPVGGAAFPGTQTHDAPAQGWEPSGDRSGTGLILSGQGFPDEPRAQGRERGGLAVPDVPEVGPGTLGQHDGQGLVPPALEPRCGPIDGAVRPQEQPSSVKASFSEAVRAEATGRAKLTQGVPSQPKEMSAGGAPGALPSRASAAAPCGLPGTPEPNLASAAIVSGGPSWSDSFGLAPTRWGIEGSEEGSDILRAGSGAPEGIPGAPSGLRTGSEPREAEGFPRSARVAMSKFLPVDSGPSALGAEDKRTGGPRPPASGARTNRAPVGRAGADAASQIPSSIGNGPELQVEPDPGLQTGGLEAKHPVEVGASQHREDRSSAARHLPTSPELPRLKIEDPTSPVAEGQSGGPGASYRAPLEFAARSETWAESGDPFRVETTPTGASIPAGQPVPEQGAEDTHRIRSTPVAEAAARGTVPPGPADWGPPTFAAREEVTSNGVDVLEQPLNLRPLAGQGEERPATGQVPPTSPSEASGVQTSERPASSLERAMAELGSVVEDLRVEQVVARVGVRTPQLSEVDGRDGSDPLRQTDGDIASPKSSKLGETPVIHPKRATAVGEAADRAQSRRQEMPPSSPDVLRSARPGLDRMAERVASGRTLVERPEEGSVLPSPGSLPPERQAPADSGTDVARASLRSQKGDSGPRTGEADGSGRLSVSARFETAVKPQSREAGTRDLWTAPAAPRSEGIQSGWASRASGRTSGPTLARWEWSGLAPQVRPVVQRLLGQGEAEVVVHLRPPELGRLRVEVKSRAGEVVVRLEAEDQATREVLRAHAGELEGSLNSQAHQPVRVEVRAPEPGSLALGEREGRRSGHEAHERPGRPPRQEVFQSPDSDGTKAQVPGQGWWA